MSGFCGWFEQRTGPLTSDDLSILDEMARAFGAESHPGSLPTSNFARTIGKHSGIAADERHEVFVVFSGRPVVGSGGTRTSTSAETARTLLQAYENRDIRFVEDLGGSFAIAVVDRRADRVLLAVDRIGIEPLCYSMTADGKVCFASRADSVAAHPDVKRELSSDAIFRFVYFHMIPSPWTVWSDVRKLEPGQVIIAEHGRKDARYYWTPTAPRQRASDRDSVIAALREETRHAVSRSITDESLGSFLSGGLDSSAVSGIANEYTSEPLRAYTIGFEQQGFDEMEFADATARHFDLNHRPYYVTPQDVAESFDLLTTYFDEPFGNSSVIPAYFCARQARSEGIDCLLAGDGGGELFGGNERYAVQTLFNYYYWLPAWLRKHVVESSLSRLPMGWSTLTHKIERYVEQASVPMPERLETYNFVSMYGPGNIFTPSFLEQVDTHSPTADLSVAYERGEGFDFLQRMLIFDWKLTLADNDLRKVAKMCEAAGVEVRFPLLDDALVDFSIGVPSKLKLSGGELRVGFKKAFEGYLPDKVIHKQKHGFGLPFGDWLKTSAVLREAILPHIESLRDRQIFNESFIDQMLQKHSHEHAGFYGNMLWIMATLDSWLTRHHD